MDSFGKSDPFVVFQDGNEEQKIITAKRTLDYDYVNEEYDLIYNPLKIQGNKEVEVEVEILPSKNKETQIELFIQPKNDKKDNQTKSPEIETNSDQKTWKIIIFNEIYF
ncbi:MAG: hypothetical protein EZS28_002564 [Streblomastix strix]|uniref:C2 domain-containing protein n=1 Tax=Streblomastix strix TaxID=222440 RepID=A0A5J4X3L7_9EUKA|nr:MAG: hypothetical protein EZS28_002564 [Streblomastix strix]